MFLSRNGTRPFETSRYELLAKKGGSLSHFEEHWIDPTNTYKRVIEIEQITRNLSDNDAIFLFEKESAIDLLNNFDCIGVNIPRELKVISVEGTFESPKTIYNACICKAEIRGNRDNRR